jgi:hypothetical protein
MSDPTSVPAPLPGDPGYRDHAAEMLARLPEQFRRKTDNPNHNEKLLLAVAEQVQSLETACQQALIQRTIDRSIGAQLDDIGELVGERRNGLDQETYRRRLRARVAVHRSKGTIEDVIRVTNLVVFDDAARIRIQPLPIAGVIVHVEGTVVSESVADTVLFEFLQATVAAGVRVILESGTTPPATRFAFDGAGPGYDAGFFIDSRG